MVYFWLYTIPLSYPEFLPFLVFFYTQQGYSAFRPHILPVFRSFCHKFFIFFQQLFGILSFSYFNLFSLFYFISFYLFDVIDSTKAWWNIPEVRGPTVARARATSLIVEILTVWVLSVWWLWLEVALSSTPGTPRHPAGRAIGRDGGHPVGRAAGRDGGHPAGRDAEDNK